MNLLDEEDEKVEETDEERAKRLEGITMSY